MPDTIDFEPAAAAVASLLPQITDDHLAAPTPCDDYRVSELLFHLLGLSLAFRDAADKNLGPTTGRAPVPDARTALPEDWDALLSERMDDLAAAWRQPAAYDGQTQVGGVTLPGAVAGRFGLNELVLHGWDLARATGQSFPIDDGSLQASLALLTGLPDDVVSSGIFKPPVDVPPAAPLLDRVVGRSGRDPGWSAGG